MVAVLAANTDSDQDHSTFEPSLPTNCGTLKVLQNSSYVEEMTVQLSEVYRKIFSDPKLLEEQVKAVTSDGLVEMTDILADPVLSQVVGNAVARSRPGSGRRLSKTHYKAPCSKTSSCSKHERSPDSDLIDPFAMFDMYAKHASNGDPSAQCALGRQYARGKPVQQDRATAYEYFRMCAKRGHAPCFHALGTMYYNGEGVARSHGKAAAMFKRAADDGFEQSRLTLQRAFSASPSPPSAYTHLGCYEGYGWKDAYHARDSIYGISTTPTHHISACFNQCSSIGYDHFAIPGNPAACLCGSGTPTTPMIIEMIIGCNGGLHSYSVDVYRILSRLELPVVQRPPASPRAPHSSFDTVPLFRQPSSVLRTLEGNSLLLPVLFGACLSLLCCLVALYRHLIRIQRNLAAAKAGKGYARVIQLGPRRPGQSRRFFDRDKLVLRQEHQSSRPQAPLSALPHLPCISRSSRQSDDEHQDLFVSIAEKMFAVTDPGQTRTTAHVGAVRYHANI